MRVAPALAVGFFIASSMPAFPYTAADARACMSDVFRLCAKAVPHQARVAACLEAKQDQLSQSCAAAFARYMRTEERRRQARSPGYED